MAEIDSIIEVDMSKAKRIKCETALQRIYYKPGGYHKNTKNLWLDANKQGYDFSLHDVDEWIKKQAIWQVYAPRPKFIPYVSFNSITVPNEVHVADLLMVPPDQVNKITYRYILKIKDVASRYLWGHPPLIDKSSIQVANAFIKIYDSKHCPLV